MNSTYRLVRSLLLISLFAATTILAQENTRQIVPEEFVKARPAKTGTGGALKQTYRIAQAGQRKACPECAQLGLTIFRLRPTRRTDTGARIIVQESEQTLEWTPERITADTPLRPGENI